MNALNLKGYPKLKLDALGKVSTKGLTEVPFHKLQCGGEYAVIGMFHAQVDGKLVGCLRWAVTATYQGQLPGDPRRLVFLDTHDGARLVVSSPEVSAGITSARVYRLRQARKSA